MLYIFDKKGTYGLGSPIQDCQRFADDFAIMFASDWSNKLSNLILNVIEM